MALRTPSSCSRAMYCPRVFFFTRKQNVPILGKGSFLLRIGPVKTLFLEYSLEFQKIKML